MRRFWLIPCLVGSLLIALAGCTESEEVKKEEVVHPSREALRLNVAILKRDDYWWFVRFSGPEEIVKQHEAAYESFVRGVRFEDKKDKKEDADEEEPVLDEKSVPLKFAQEPKEWKKDPFVPDKIRVYAYRLNTQPKDVQIVITRLKSAHNTMLSNLHRWQKEMSVPPSETVEDAQAKGFLKRDKIGEQEVWWVAMNGLGTYKETKPLEPVRAKKIGPMPLLKVKKDKGDSPGFPFRYEVPAGWTKKPRRQMIIEAFEVAEGGKSAETTLSTFGGSVGANINRWRGMVKLPELEDGAAEKSAERRMVAGINAYYVNLHSPGADQRILAVVIPSGGKLWFVRMAGPPDFVEKHRPAFERFVDSFKR